MVNINTFDRFIILEVEMDYNQEELLEAKRQINSTIHKLKETIKSLEAKENVHRYKSQITLAKRRIVAFEISVTLIEKELANFKTN